jgi:GNAT superfamily N-acetyltransferase
MRVLGADHYSPVLIEKTLVEMGTMDTRLVADGIYHVAEHAGRIIGSAGWTRREPNYGPLMDELPAPLSHQHGRIALVRSVYVAPEFARRGVARRLMAEVEAEMHRTAGVHTAELMATLGGEKLYRTLGYARLSTHWLRMSGGHAMELRRMTKALAERSPGTSEVA